MEGEAAALSEDVRDALLLASDADDVPQSTNTLPVARNGISLERIFLVLAVCAKLDLATAKTGYTDAVPIRCHGTSAASALDAQMPFDVIGEHAQVVRRRGSARFGPMTVKREAISIPR